MVFSLQKAQYNDFKQIAVPCGRCIGCRLEYARRWAIRCVHESKLWERNCFVTLTYDDRYIPDGGSLRPRDFVLFMKRLRFEYGAGIRFFQCGEYGEQLSRPHHHCLLFNHSFPDMRLLRRSNDIRLFRSESLDRLWGHGYCSIGEVSFESAGYVARYSLKKVRGPHAAAHYGGRVPEYCTMSRKPGIGAGFVQKFASDMYPSGTVTLRGGVTMGTPRFYDVLHEKVDPEGMRRLRAQRREILKNDVDNEGHKLYIREEVAESRLSTLVPRSLEAL